MTLPRLLIAHFVIALVGLGSLACIVLDREGWPFSNYPMYSDLRGGRIQIVHLYAETPEGETPLLDDVYWVPYGVMRLNHALSICDARADRDACLAAALAHLAERYERRRAKGRHRGPSLGALRAYEVTWTLTSGARNREHPDSRRLLAQHIVDAAR